MKLFLALLLTTTCVAAQAQSSWRPSLHDTVGPGAIVELPAFKGGNRLAIITFEYARKCDPTLSLVTMRGRSLGPAEKQQLLPPSHIGSIVNGKRYNGPAVMSTYANGIDVGFAMPNDMAMVVAFDRINTFTFITPKGEELPLPTAGLKQAIDASMGVCVDKVQP